MQIGFFQGFPTQGNHCCLCFSSNHRDRERTRVCYRFLDNEVENVSWFFACIVLSLVKALNLKLSTVYKTNSTKQLTFLASYFSYAVLCYGIWSSLYFSTYLYVAPTFCKCCLSYQTFFGSLSWIDVKTSQQNI